MKETDTKDRPGASDGPSPEEGDRFPPPPVRDYPPAPMGPLPDSGPPYNSPHRAPWPRPSPARPG